MHVASCVSLLLLLRASLAFSGRELYSVPECSRTGPRVDCGRQGIEKDECISIGCCFIPFTKPGVRQPDCFTRNKGPSNYKVEQKTPLLGDRGVNLTLQSVVTTQPELGPDTLRLNLTTSRTAGILRVTISPAKRSRYVVPKHLFRTSINENRSGGAVADLVFDYTADPFSFAVSQTSGRQETLFNTSDFRFIFKDQYMELTTSVASSTQLYGLGERTASAGLALPRDGIPITLWNRDANSRFPDQNLYGSFPLLLQLSEEGTASGVLLLNSNGMDVILTEESVSFRVLGGVWDLFFFAGPTPAAVLEQYTRVVGRPKMPPRWSLGFHQCKYGYKSVHELREVVANYSRANIPLETMWTDIDYMALWKDFTLDGRNFPADEMKAFVDGLHNKSMHYVVIVDPGIKLDANYTPYLRGLQEDIFIKDATGVAYTGQVWPGPTHYPDFLNPKTAAYWQRELQDFYKLVPYDGIWIDMNEASNFCTGEVCSLPPEDTEVSPARRNDWTTCRLECKTVSTGSDKSLLFPPYAISNGNALLPLLTRTLPTTARHSDGNVEYDVHNLYGLSESKTTAAAIENITNKRSFVLTRSGFPGTGAYAAKWTGDNGATWKDLKWSVASILNIGLSGIPLVGADICGFVGYTTEELCTRWISAGAFYPFARDHSDLDSGYQELYRWPFVAATARNVLGLRYKLLTYLSTAFRQAAYDGSPVARPLWYEYPEDVATHAIDQQWLLGRDVLVSPVLEEGASNVDAYFPEGIWYSAFFPQALRGGDFQNLNAPLGEVPVHFRGGSIVPLQNATLTTSATLRSAFTLAVFLPDMLEEAPIGTTLAEGQLWYEDGNNIKANESSVLLGLKLQMMSNDRNRGISVALYSEILSLPASASSPDSECFSIGLPPLREVRLYGWNRGIDQIVASGGDFSDDSEFEWKRLENGAIVMQNLDIPWRCTSVVEIRWWSANEADIALRNSERRD